MALPGIKSELNKEVTKRSLALFNWSLSFRSVYDVVCVATGFVFADFILSLGIAKEKMGLFYALANAACLFQLVGLWALTRARDRKHFALGFATLEPALFLLAILAALLLGADLRLWALLALLFLAGAAAHISRPTTDEWLASSIPVSVRGRFLGKRLQISSIVLICTTLAAGFLARQIDRENSWGFGLLMIVGCCTAFVAVQALRPVPMPAISAEGQIHWADLPGLWRHRPFRRVVLGTILYNLPFTLAGPFYQVFHLKVLGLNEFAISCMVVGYYVVKICISPFLGRWVDRLGPRLSTYLISPTYLLLFAIYACSGPEHAWLVFLGWALAGIGDGAFFVANQSALYSAIPETSRPAYFAAYSLLCLLPNAVGAFAATLLAGWLKYAAVDLGPLHLGQFNLLYAIVGGLFLLCLFGAQLYPGRVKR